jgi:thymidylate synthase
MSPSATTELGPASGPDVQLKPEETPTHKAPRQHASHEEYQYLDLIRDILEEGEHRPDRYLVLLSYYRNISNTLF